MPRVISIRKHRYERQFWSLQENKEEAISWSLHHAGVPYILCGNWHVKYYLEHKYTGKRVYIKAIDKHIKRKSVFPFLLNVPGLPGRILAHGSKNKDKCNLQSL